MKFSSVTTSEFTECNPQLLKSLFSLTARSYLIFRAVRITFVVLLSIFMVFLAVLGLSLITILRNFWPVLTTVEIVKNWPNLAFWASLHLSLMQFLNRRLLQLEKLLRLLYHSHLAKQVKKPT